MVAYSPTEEQSFLQEQVRDLLTARAQPDVLRQLITEQVPCDEGLWSELGKLGFLGAAIPEEFGGVGLGARELAIIMEEMGRSVAPVPFFSSLCLAAEAINLAGTTEQKARWLPGLASGEVIGTFATTEGAAAVGAGNFTTRFADGHISGTKFPVPDASSAHICVVAVAGGRLAVVDLRDNGVVLKPLKGFDELRHHAEIIFNSAPAELLAGDGAADAVETLLNRAAVYQAFEQIGGAEAALYMARDYAMQRYIFGRTLASYQITKHKLAELLIQIELARSIALHAIQALQEGSPDFPRSAATARLSASRAYENAARENLQVHGGIGFTWEANVHFHLRRARLLALDLGSAEIWTDRLIDELSAEVDRATAS